jgi:CheY-like chemotaxis protein
MAKNQKFDFILMDIHSPEINGTIATQQIRVFESVSPIIAITAISSNEKRETLLSFHLMI